MSNIAVFPGSFDPITIGHIDLVNRALPLFDQIIIAIGINSKKKTFFTLEQRTDWIKEVFKNNEKISVESFEGLTVDFCERKNARYLLRGLRNASDFDYEKTISQINHIVGKKIETIFLISKPELSHVSSSIVREIIGAGGDVSVFLPKNINLKKRK
ncbi:MAG: pantetheine-phosphate adenylyltransferase [Saprospiraceae bacterium]|nr:pantetheine-phosphate adenylyltransferase [Saprospiraceae bacterium]